ncbi:hypothetical protein EG835_15280, partial [bacterium]|nr:hypothetical protein [bacterium]
MAINKKKATPVVKIGIWVISAVLVLSFTLPLLISGLGSNSGSNADSQGKLDALAAQYGGTVQSLE